MGEFTTRVRHKGKFYTGSVPGQAIRCYGDADYIYSWRSRRTKHDIGDREAGTFAGIRMPLSSGPLLDVLADRKRYAEDIMNTMGGVTSNARPPTQMNACLSTDNGHPFTSVKVRSLNVGRVHQTGPLGVHSTPIFGMSSAMRQNEITSTPGFPSSVYSSASGLQTPSVLERNARLAPIFAEMLPTKSVAQIGETVVSLLRGEWPQLLRNLGKLLTKLQTLPELGKDAARLAGGEYLNSVFGWQPLIRDFENAIRVLTTVDHLVYGSTYRRHRTISWPTQFRTETNPRVSISTPWSPSGSSSSTSFPDALRGYSETIRSYDIRLSARLVPIARPGLGANAFIDEAVEKLEMIGLWYPALGWDLLPYSWLIDWATSLGSAITNASKYGSKPGQVNIDYAWMTSCMKVNVRGGFERSGVWMNVGAYRYKAEGYYHSFSVSKTRFSASPFGIGLDISALNGAQVSILVALGLARLR